ncbi:MAG: amino acid ABC transporter ATP-binding protein, partial [Leucobacter sp.]|nr:amino acid ABC transporter ATP-binding protein [Leucobacter sp.]
MSATMVEIRGLQKSFHGHTVLKDISLTVESGSVTCLLGPSGSGKTTLLRCVNRLEVADAGIIMIDGELVGAERRGSRLIAASPKAIAHSRQLTGMVFQRFNLFPHR